MLTLLNEDGRFVNRVANTRDKSRDADGAADESQWISHILAHAQRSCALSG